MPSRFTVRIGRSMRGGVAWLALLALALPGVASVRGLCCGPEMAKSADCCAAAMKMPGMDSSQMPSTGAVVDDGHSDAMTATDCAPVLEPESSAYLVRNEGSFDGSPLTTREIHPALGRSLVARIAFSVTPALLLVEGRPPRISLPDSPSAILRI